MHVYIDLYLREKEALGLAGRERHFCQSQSSSVVARSGVTTLLVSRSGVTKRWRVLVSRVEVARSGVTELLGGHVCIHMYVYVHICI